MRPSRGGSSWSYVRWVGAFLVALALVALAGTVMAGVVEAQRSGGRIRGGSGFGSSGGSGFGGSSRSGGSGFGGSSRSSGSGFGGSSRSSGSGFGGSSRSSGAGFGGSSGRGSAVPIGGGEPHGLPGRAAPTMSMLPAVGILILCAFGLVLLRAGPASPPPRPLQRALPTYELSRISIGLDARARRRIQAALAAAARESLPDAQFIREVVAMLRREELSWLYAYWRSYTLPANEAERAFESEIQDLRARYDLDIVERSARGLEERATGTTPHAHEGDGLVVVSLVVAARGDATREPAVEMSRESVASALLRRTAFPSDSIAVFEVLWSPAEEGDRMSSLELEERYPELRLIDPESFAGRVFCAYCNGPFPLELPTCPHCGAPSEASRGRRRRTDVPRG